ncbi:MAG TPA: hypothetical protein VJV79_09380 [Polyangiaceae bacterium]|nr:hypothetical protein [Polyangiaceae bacterium]
MLGLAPSATRLELERAGQRLLAELAIGRKTALEYDTPVGRNARTPELVRQALAELRDPGRRLVHEAWLQLAAPLP